MWASRGASRSLVARWRLPAEPSQPRASCLAAAAAVAGLALPQTSQAALTTRSGPRARASASSMTSRCRRPSRCATLGSTQSSCWTWTCTRATARLASWRETTASSRLICLATRTTRTRRACATPTTYLWRTGRATRSTSACCLTGCPASSQSTGPSCSSSKRAWTRLRVTALAASASAARASSAEITWCTPQRWSTRCRSSSPWVAATHAPWTAALRRTQTCTEPPRTAGTHGQRSMRVPPHSQYWARRER
mmetsp:Transcript_430/g.1160  ORF Transcript_430/g.1160 Transcript_430/m.1160 type:complete len:252 (+) Transcript_430:59-814(+)